MRATFSPTANALYVYVTIDKPVARTVEMREGVNVDYDEYDRVWGVEIIGAFTRADFDIAGLDGEEAWQYALEAIRPHANSGSVSTGIVIFPEWSS